jgi:hypothetical protein
MAALGSGSGTTGLGLGDGVAGAHSSETGTGTAAQYQPSSVSGSGRVRVPAGTSEPFYIVNNHRRIFRKNPLVIYNITSAFLLRPPVIC